MSGVSFSLNDSLEVKHYFKYNDHTYEEIKLSVPGIKYTAMLKEQILK